MKEYKCLTNYTLNRIYQLLKTQPDIFVFTKIRGRLGDCDWEQIRIDPFNNYSNFIAVLIHESLHWFYPKWCETKVLKHEKIIMRTITKRQIKRLGSKILELL